MRGQVGQVGYRMLEEGRREMEATSA